MCCDGCHAEHLVAFSCKKRGFCPNCDARRVAENAALLVDEVFPKQPVRRPVGAERSVPVALAVREPHRRHGTGAGDRLPLRRHAPGEEDGVFP